MNYRSMVKTFCMIKYRIMTLWKSVRLYAAQRSDLRNNGKYQAEMW